jgi:ubiquinone/menaquinone biosynthesis C-methylase UbiE
MDTNNENYYDSVANQYAAMSFARSKYLRAVDQIVIKSLKKINAKNLLDIGAGDGRRSKSLADALNIKQIVAVESSPNMAAEAKELLGEKNVLSSDAAKLNLPDDYFDAVVSLWNVFGHISSESDRIEILRKISKSLKSNGKCIIDVNNRYNIRHYGWLAAVRNAYNDLVGKMDSGWFSLNINHVEGKVYLHRPVELKRYLVGVNLQVENIYYVDYDSGEIRKTPWSGQSVYVLSRII